ncbi:MAG TPA: alanine dehydrogenase [Porticoccaceae bacterium]|nr:alanine dehydrogenase [Porticoccaceae bacterium]
MKIGIPKEIKADENRVALTPVGARALIDAGHNVSIEQDAGAGSGFTNGEYESAGAVIVSTEAAWDAELVLKVKEPAAREYDFLRQQLLFTYFHLAGVDPKLTETLLARGTTAIAYETVEDDSGKLPLLAPMSAVAGSMAVTVGNYYLAKFNGGRGMLLAELFDQRYGKVLIVGDGVVGQHGAKVAARLGAEVYVAGNRPDNTQSLARALDMDLHFIQSNEANIAQHLGDADLVIGGVLVRGGRAPHVISEAMVKTMQPGSVIVDVSIDQGGCVETARPTTHSDPIYVHHDVIHYCVANMPGAYPRLSTMALTGATLPYALKLAAEGENSLKTDGGFGKGVNTYHGHITCQPVAISLGMESQYRPFQRL